MKNNRVKVGRREVLKVCEQGKGLNTSSRRLQGALTWELERGPQKWSRQIPLWLPWGLFFETYCMPGTVSSILHPHSVLEGWHYLSPFLQMGENEAQRSEATSPSKGDRHTLD